MHAFRRVHSLRCRAKLFLQDRWIKHQSRYPTVRNGKRCFWHICIVCQIYKPHTIVAFTSLPLDFSNVLFCLVFCSVDCLSVDENSLTASHGKLLFIWWRKTKSLSKRTRIEFANQIFGRRVDYTLFVSSFTPQLSTSDARYANMQFVDIL